MAEKVNKANEKRRRDQQRLDDDCEDSQDSASVCSANETPRGKTPRDVSSSKKRKDRSSVSSVGGTSKRGRDSDATGNGSSVNQPRRTMTTSQTFPRSDWPPGYSSEQVDNLTTQQVIDMKAMRLKEASKPGGTKSLPGWKMIDNTVVIPIEMIKGGNDDATTCFTPGRWKRFPISVIKRWWENLPLEWPDIVPEFGVEERGMQNRIPREVSCGLCLWILV